MSDIQNKINKLGPWIFSYERKDGAKIDITQIEGLENEYKWKDIMQKKYYLKEVSGIADVLFNHDDTKDLRAIDLGCQEGQFSDILCSKNFKEVVSVDLSAKYVEKADFLLNEFKEYKNSKVLQGNVLDTAFMSSLGKFNFIIAKAIFYHMKDPILLFDIFELLKPKDGSPFYIILDQRYKTNSLNFLFSDNGMAEIVKSNYMDQNINDAYSEISTRMGSVYDRARTRLNPQSIFYLTRKYGYFGTIEYDLGSWSASVFCSRFLLTSEKNSSLIKNLNNKFKDIKGVFYFWEGRSISGYDFRKSFLFKIFNSSISKRLTYYINSFLLTQIKYKIALQADPLVQKRFYEDLYLSAKNNKSKFEKFKLIYFGGKFKHFKKNINNLY
jgi:2-polyprenyl-3-methyl-5-hydroxy-6-metoxy-1,4-benzoquinol methylase